MYQWKLTFLVASIISGAVADNNGQGYCADDAFSVDACNLCVRNEIYDGTKCMCPNALKTCGDVTPFNNDVITIACWISTIFIVFHVVHFVFFASKDAHGDGDRATARVAPIEKSKPRAARGPQTSAAVPQRVNTRSHKLFVW